MDEDVSVVRRREVSYPDIEDILFPAVPFIELTFIKDTSHNNDVFPMVRDALHYLKLDDEHYGTQFWNPFQDGIVKPGNTVLVKPNMVNDSNAAGTDCLYTHPSVVAAVIAYVYKALEGKGKIIIADAPMQFCNFSKLVKQSGYDKIVEFYHSIGANIEIKDLRGTYSTNTNGYQRQIHRKDFKCIITDLKNESEHASLDSEQISNMRITCYDPAELKAHQNTQKHEYAIAEDALLADVIINIPKPKSHRKAGVTLGLKNFVGINALKEYLPHHRIGDKPSGGDEYKKKSCILRLRSAVLDYSNKAQVRKHLLYHRMLSILVRTLTKVDRLFVSRQLYSEGSWYGNDTIWRTVIDINKIINYSDQHGVLHDTAQRNIFTLADMIIIGEKEGPLCPSPYQSGIIAASRNTVCFDEICATVLGLNLRKIPIYQHARDHRRYALVAEDQRGIIVSNVPEWNNKNIDTLEYQFMLHIEPTAGWKGHIEITQPQIE